MDSSRPRSRGFGRPRRRALAAAGLLAIATSGGRLLEQRHGRLRSLGAANRLQAQYEQVVRDVLPSVVQISTDTSTGSGVVYDRHGDIVTNEHVVGTAKTVKVQESVGNTSLTAKVVGHFAPRRSRRSPGGERTPASLKLRQVRQPE